MKIENKSGHGLSHIVVDDKNKKTTYFCKNGEYVEVPDEIAKLWLKIDGVKEYADPAELQKLKEEIAELKETKKSKKK